MQANNRHRRKTIPVGVKLEVALRALGFAPGEAVEFDHQPPLALREWDEAANDTVPAANDPDHIVILSKPAHRQKTTGRKGESKLSISYDGDVSRIAKAKRLARSQEEFARRLLARASGDDPPEEKRTWKRKWPKRPFDRRRTDGSTAQSDRAPGPAPGQRKRDRRV